MAFGWPSVAACHVMWIWSISALVVRNPSTSKMSTAPEPVRSSGATRPICQSQRMGWPVLSRCGGYQHAPDEGATQGPGAGMGTTCQRNETSSPLPRSRYGPPRGAIRRRASPCRSGTWMTRSSMARRRPGGETRRPVGRVEVRRIDLEVLLGRGGVLLGRPVDELGRRCPAGEPPHGRGRHGGYRGADDLERERRGIGLHHLGRGFGQLQAHPDVRVADDVSARGERRRGRIGRGHTMPSLWRTRLPVVRDLEAEDAISGWEMGRCPREALRFDHPAVRRSPAIFSVPWLTGGRMGRAPDVPATTAPAGTPERGSQRGG